MEIKKCCGNCASCLKCASDPIIGKDGKLEVEKYDTMHIDGVTFSLGNGKTGPVMSVSLNNDFCDPSWPCYEFCYAKRLASFRSTVMTSYNNNTDILLNDHVRFWGAVKKAYVYAYTMGIGFRWHIDGEMPDIKYFINVTSVCRQFPVESILMTKRYDIVNDYCDEFGKETIPANLHTAFSLQFHGQEINNPYGFPTRGFIAKGLPTDGINLCPNQTAKKIGKKWTCADCLIHKSGCFGDECLSFLQH